MANIISQVWLIRQGIAPAESSITKNKKTVQIIEIYNKK